MNLNDVLTHSREMRFDAKTEDELHQMLIVCGNHTGQAGDLYTSNQIPHAVKMIHEELSRRQRNKNHQELVIEQKNLQQTTKIHSDTLHSKTMDELEKLKVSVDRLAGARWIDWAILIAGVIAAIAAVIAIVISFHVH